MAETVLSAGAPAPAEKVSKTLFITFFLILIFYFRAKGGYMPVELEIRRE